MGIVIRTFGRLVIGYMVFAVVIQGLGAGRFFNDLALRLVGKTRAGNAKVAIIASGFFGSISGSATGNVVTTGAFTIPAMKREGLPPHFAGAVEACASAGGCLMPPVMGAVAFIMAEFIEVPYAEIALVAVVPSLLYYLCLFCQIDAFAARIGIKPAEIAVNAPPIWLTILRNMHIILSFLLLIFLLFFLRLSAQGPWIAAASAILIGMVRKETRIDVKRLLRLLEESGKMLGELIGIMGPVGLIIGSFVLTGLAYSFPYEIVDLAGGNLFIMLAMGAVASFILGMGVAMQAVYIFLALVLAPGLVLGGFDLIAVHFFILYCAVWSTITPPVAITAFVAATIAGSSPMRTGVEAMKLGMAKYILPFIFINSPALILRGKLMDMLFVIPSTTLALIVMSAALEGYFWKIGRLTILMRGMLFISGILLAVPNIKTDLYGLGILAFILGIIYLLREKKPFHGLLGWKAEERKIKG